MKNRDIQELELQRKHGYRAVKHQSFVGAGYFDLLNQAITGGASSTEAMRGSTEEAQFRQKTPEFVEAEGHHSAGEPLPVEPSFRLVPPVVELVKASSSKSAGDEHPGRASARR